MARFLVFRVLSWVFGVGLTVFGCGGSPLTYHFGAGSDGPATGDDGAAGSGGGTGGDVAAGGAGGSIVDSGSGGGASDTATDRGGADLADSQADGVCASQCSANEKRCTASGGVQSCVSDAAGCRTWSAEAKCPAPMACSGSGVCGCPNPTCAEGSKRCSQDNGSVQICRSNGSCLDWALDQTCSMTCQNSVCVCRQENPANRVPNGGFDKDLGSWMVSGNAVWSSQDADGCSGSGSVSMNAAANTGVIVSPCIPIPGALGDFYNVGASVMQPAGAMYLANCELRYFLDSACANEMTPSTFLTARNVQGWQKMNLMVDVPGGINGVILDCGPAGAGGTGTFLFDQVFFTKAPGTF